MPNRRPERVASFLQQELSLIIQRELTDPRIVGFPSITRVKVSDDLSAADIYMTIMGTEGEQTACINAIRHSAGLMRTRLTKILTMRQVPFLKFHIDEQLRKELEVLNLIAKVNDEKAEMEERAAKEQARKDAEEAEQSRARAAREKIDAEETRQATDGKTDGE